MSSVIFPQIHVSLIGRDGNAFAILGAVQKALKRADVPETKIQEFIAEATSGDYDHLLQTCLRWVSVS